MKIIQSFAQFEDGHIKGCKSVDMRKNFYTFLLSYLTLKKYYGYVTMYCNRLAYDTFIKYIPYDRIIIKENKYSKKFWSAYKLDVIESQTENFIHVDSDVFIFDDLFKNFINGDYDIIIQNVYKELDQNLIDMKLYDKICPSYIYDKRGFGCGVIGMKINVKDIYIKNTKYVYNLIENNLVEGDLKHFGFVLEELTLYFTALANKFNWFDVLPHDDILSIGLENTGNKYKYTHLWNNSKYDVKIINTIKNKIKKDFNEYYYLINKFENPPLKNKNLVYYNVGYNEKYNKLLELSLMTLKKFFNGDILIITDYKNSLLLKSNPLFDDVDFMICEIPNIFYSAMNKLKIYEYSKFYDYDNILYLDCDTIVVNNLDSIFDKTTKNKKIGICEEYETIISGDRKHYFEKSEIGYKMYLDLYGSVFFNDDEIKKYGNRNGLNSGIFCIPVLDKSRTILEKIYNDAVNDFNNKKYYFLDQPYICYNLMIHDYYFILSECYLAGDGLDKFNSSEIFNINTKYNFNKYSIVHFLNDIGNSDTKYFRMIYSFPKKIIDNIINKNVEMSYNFDSNVNNNKNIKLLTVTWSYEDSFDFENSILYKNFIKYNSKSNYINIHFNRKNYKKLEEEYLKNYGHRSEYILYKIYLIQEKIKDIDADYIIFADATDTICFGNIQSINIPKEITFSSEINKYPSEKYSQDYNSEWKIDYNQKDKNDKNYLNSGLYIADKKNFLKLIENVNKIIENNKYKSFLGDQGVYTYYYLNNYEPNIKLDNLSDIFFTSTNKIYSNYLYYKFPIFLHDPAMKYDGSKFLEKFNLNI